MFKVRNVLINLLMKLIDICYFYLPSPLPSKNALEKTQIIAHRGRFNHSVYPENALKAIESAHMMDAGGVEIDIRWTKDLVLVIHHDPDLARVFKKDVVISQVSFSELRQIEPQVPSLGEVVQEFGGKITLYLELKEEYFPDLIKQKETLRQILSSLHPTSDFFLMSLSIETLKNFDLYPGHVYFSIARFDMEEKLTATMENKWAGVTGHYFMLKKRDINFCEENHLQYGTGFPGSLNVYKREINRGVRRIFTNHPDRLMKYKRKLLAAIEA